nr:hypothetical protein [Tanacetum cinerariifolium]
MDEEINEQEMKAHYSYMEKIQEHCKQSESTSNTCLVENDDSNATPESPNMCEHDIQTDQNAKDKHAALANLIANLKFNVDENKKIQNQLKKANTSLAHELKQCKSILAETSKTLEESNSVRDRLLAQKDIDIKEDLELKAYEILVVKEKHNELVKQSLLTKSHYEGLVNEKIKVQYNDEYNVFANVNQHCKQSESTSNTCLVENDDSNATPESPDMCKHDIQTDQNAKDEHAALANLIANLKFNVDENKK